jgi:hypothetical protein
MRYLLTTSCPKSERRAFQRALIEYFFFSLLYIFRIAFCRGVLCHVSRIYICRIISNLRIFRPKSPLDKILIITKTSES